MDCIVCNRPLMDFDGADNQPIGGTEFTTRGHYGSAVTDQMGAVTHIINVCDPCLSKALLKGTARAIPSDKAKKPMLSGEAVLGLKMERNDAGAETVKDYLKTLLSEIMTQRDSFSAKTPFGNSDWDYELYKAMGYIEPDADNPYSFEEMDEMLHRAVKAL